MAPEAESELGPVSAAFCREVNYIHCQQALNLTATIAELKADHLMRRMLALAHEDRKATIGGLIRLVDNLSDDEKATLSAALQNSSR